MNGARAAYNTDLQPYRATVVIPTLSADHALWECVEGLHRQTYRDFCIVIVDNSGGRRVEQNWPNETSRAGVAILHPGTNIGFGAAVNLALREAPAEFIAVINDDAIPEPEWLNGPAVRRRERARLGRNVDRRRRDQQATRARPAAGEFFSSGRSAFGERFGIHLPPNNARRNGRIRRFVFSVL